MFDQASNKESLHNAFCVLPLKLCSDVTQIRFLIGCFFPLALGLPFKCNVERGGNTGSNMLLQHDVGQKYFI